MTLYALKRVVYQLTINLQQSFWRLTGGRRIQAFNEEYRLNADTIFPDYRNFRLPQNDAQSKIVKFTDYVQLHSVVTYASQLDHKGLVFVDIGAHHGAYAVVLGKIAQRHEGKVLAVEPNPESFGILTKNIEMNCLRGTVICEQAAVSDMPGQMYLTNSGTQSSLSENQNGSRQSVRVVTLDNLLNKYGLRSVDLLLIDVEGAELPVLKSCPLEKVNFGRIYCELHPYAWKEFGYTGEEFSDFLSEHRFRCFDMYLREHAVFNSAQYIGPTVIIPE